MSIFQVDWYEKIKPFIQSQGAQSVGVVGNCWGAYFVMHTSTDSLVKCGFSTHPAHVGVMGNFPDEVVEDLYVEVNENGAAQYFGNTPQEGPEYRPGGPAEEILDTVNLNLPKSLREQVHSCYVLDLF